MDRKISFFEPLGQAWIRMKMALFQPFDLQKWFVIGFNAFLAGLADWHHGSSGSRTSDDVSFREFLRFPSRAWEWLMDHPGWFIAILFIAGFLILLGIVLLWLSSRGKFMFLDNVVHGKAEVAKPWREFRKEGNSLFLWRLVFVVICFAVFIIFFVFFFTAASYLYEESFYQRVPVFFIVGMGLLFLMMIIVIGYVTLFLDGFVVPIMWKHQTTATKGWGRFLSLFGRYPFHFILFGLLMFVMVVLFVIFVVIAGLLTCCIGWVLLIIPYIGTVVTLPIWYTFRAFSVEFLGQFGTDYKLYPPSSDAQPEEAPA
jgi:hypothetical protein